MFSDAATVASHPVQPATPARLAPEAYAVVHTANREAKARLAGLPAETVRELHETGYALIHAPIEGSSYGETIQAAAIVNKPLDEAFRFVADPNKQTLYLPGVAESITVEKTKDTELVRFKVQVLFSTFEFHTLHKYDPKAKTVTWSLDTSRKNDIAGQKGTWRLYALSPGHTLIFYSTEFDTGFMVPHFIQTFLARTYTKTMLANFKKFVESGGTFRKEERMESFQ